jgi:hypothetical protein
MALISTYKKLALNDKAKALSNSLRGAEFDEFKENI